MVMMTENGTNATWDPRLPLQCLSISVDFKSLKTASFKAAEFDIDFQVYNSRFQITELRTVRSAVHQMGWSHMHLNKYKKLLLCHWIIYWSLGG